MDYAEKVGFQVLSLRQVLHKPEDRGMAFGLID
jgi:hypothetical protein